MAWKLTIGGTDKTTDIWRGEPVTFERTMNDRATAFFSCTPDLVPARAAEVIIYATDGTTPLFGGLIIPGGRAWEGHARASADVWTAIECGDFFTYLDWTYVTLTYSVGPTLRDVLEDLIAALPVSTGITLDPTQAAGPTLEPFTWTNKRASEALREVCARSGYVARVSPLKVLAAAVPGTTPAGGAYAAPFSITDAAWHCDELTAKDSDRLPANKILLQCGPSAISLYTETWTAMGSETSWVARVPAAGPGGYWVVVVDPPTGDTYYGTVGDGAMFSWDWTTATLTSNIGAPVSGTILSFQYTAQYPFTVTATSSETPVIEYLATAEDCLSPDQGQEIADGLLAQMNQPAAREISFTSREHGWMPGQALTVNLTARSVVGTFVITAVAATLSTDTRWEYVVTALEGSTYQGNYLDEWRSLTGSSTGIAVTSAGLLPGGVGALGYLNVRDFGATGDGTTDDTAAIQAALDTATGATSGATVYFPAGTYQVTSLDLSSTATLTPTQSIRLIGDGQWATALRGTSAGAILLDAIGRSYLTIDDLRLTTNGTAVYQCALLLARRTGGAIECRSNNFARLRIDGEYSIASVVAIASEINTWTNCELINDDATNGYCCFFTSINNALASVTSTHGTPLESTNTYNLMTHVTWYTPYNNATPVILHQSAGYTFIACTAQIGDKTGVKCVTYIDDGGGTGGGFKGPVIWQASLWECTDCTVHYLHTDTIALGYYSGIYDIGGTFMAGAGVAVSVIAPNATPAVLLTSRIADVRFIGGSATSTLTAAVDHAGSTTIDIWSPEFDTTIAVSTSWAGCYFRAQTVTAPAETVPYPDHPITVLETVASSSHTHDGRYVKQGTVSATRVPYVVGTEVITDGALEVWTSSTNLTSWTEYVSGTSSVNREASSPHGGTYAARLDIDASNNTAYLLQGLALTAEKAYRLRLWYKTSAAGQGSFQLYDNASNVWLHSDGIWGEAAGIELPAATGWTLFEILFAGHASYSTYVLLLGAGTNFSTSASKSLWLDDLSLIATDYADTPIASDGSKVGIGTEAPQELVQILKDGTPAEGSMGLSILAAAGDTELGFGASASGDYAWIQAFQDATSWTTRKLKLMPMGGALVRPVLVEDEIDSAAVQTKTGATTLTDNVATTILTLAMADGSRTGGELSLYVEATDASADNDSHSVLVRFAAQRKGASVTTNVQTIGTAAATKSHGGAAMTVVVTVDGSSGTSAVVKVQANTALTPTTLKAHWRLQMDRAHGALT